MFQQQFVLIYKADNIEYKIVYITAFSRTKPTASYDLNIFGNYLLQLPNTWTAKYQSLLAGDNSKCKLK